MRKFLLLLTLLVAPAAYAQNGFFYNLDPPAPNATLTVCILPSPGPSPTPCTATLAAASLFSDAALTVPAANPVQLGPAGTYGFWVAAGQYVVQLSGSVSKSYVVTLGGGSGGAGTLPRLDQVLDQNQNKAFNQGGSSLSFGGGPGLNLSSETSPFRIPSIANCTVTNPGDFCYDSTFNNYVGDNGVRSLFGVFDPTAVTTNDIAGFKIVAGQYTLQDLGSTTTGGITPGDTFITANITNIREGDSICFDVGSGAFVNCTEGVPVTVISATTYTVDCSTDRGAYLIFTATSPISVTLPQATTGSNACDANFFTYFRTLSADLTVTPTTSTINDGGGAGATLVIHPGYGTNIFSDNTNYFAKVAPFREGVKPLRSDEGFDIATVGGYDYQIPNNTGTGTVANKMACNDGTGKAIICPFASSATDNPVGVAISAIGAAPGTTGNTGICLLGYCSVIFDNTATANHFAQVSASVNGDLTDVGASAPTDSRPYYTIFQGNSGAGTAAIIRVLTPSELSAACRGNCGGNTGGITSINTVATGPNVNVIGAGATTVSTAGNTVTVFGGTAGSIAGTWKNIAGSSYTVVDGDNQTRLRFGGTTVAVTLPQPNTVTTSPFIAQRVQANAQGSANFTSSAFTTVAGHQLWVAIVGGDTHAVTSVTLNPNDPCTKQSETVNARIASLWYCPNLTGSGSTTLNVQTSVAFANATGVFATELVGTTNDNSSTAVTPSGFTALSVTDPVHFADAVSMIVDQNGANLFPPWVETDTLGNSNIGEAGYRLLSNNSSVTANIPAGLALGQTILSTSSHAAFTAGWYVVMSNTSSTYDTVTSTSSTINGQTTLVLAPNESCGLMSNGANWDAICWSTPNLVNNAVAGQATIIYGKDSASQTGAISDTNMTTAPADQPYRFSGTVACHTSVSTATATLNLKYTDVSNTAQTVSATATCTTLGAASVAQITQTLRAKSGTAVTYGVTIANSPNYDVSVRLEGL